MRKIAKPASALLFSLTLCSGAFAQLPDTLKIGTLLPMSGGGAILGASYIASLQATIKDVNEKGGILGKPIELVVGDDGGDPTQGVNEARRLAQSVKVHFVLGSASSTITLAAMPIFTEAKILQFSSTGAKEATVQRGPYHFSTLSSGGEAQAANFIDFALNIAKVKKVSLLADTSPLYRDLVEITQSMAKTRGLTITSAEAFDPRTPDLLPHLLRARRSSPDMLWMLGLYPIDVITTMKGMKEIGWNAPLALGLGGGSQAGALPTIMPADQLLPYTAQVFQSSTYCSNTPLGESSVPKTLAWLKPRVANFEKQLASGLISAYDTIMILKQVYTATGSFDSTAAADWIERNSDKIQSVQFKFSKPGKAHHFLVGPENMAMSENAHLKREDGLTKRAGC